jgi:hypothetical protein
VSAEITSPPLATEGNSLPPAGQQSVNQYNTNGIDAISRRAPPGRVGCVDVSSRFRQWGVSKSVLMWIFLRGGGAELVSSLADEWRDWLEGRLPAGSRMT